MEETLYEKHLRIYSEDALTQKFRAETAYDYYVDADYKLRNAILDEGTLLNELIAKDPSALDKITLIERRVEKNESVLSDTTRYMNETKKRIIELSNALQIHLHEYSDSQIASSGFITHTIVNDYSSKNDKTAKIIKLDDPSKAEYGIANSLDRWRDASKLKIFVRK